MLKFLTPEIYSGIMNTLVVFFDTAQAILAKGKDGMEAGVILPSIAPLAK